MIKKYQIVLGGLLLFFSFAYAQDELIDLYRLRMKADKDDNLAELVSIDANLAQVYIAKNDYLQAKSFLERAISIAKEPQLSELKLDLYRLLMIESEFDKAESGLISIYFYSENEDLKVRSAYLLGILNALKGKYDVSRQYLTQSLKLSGDWTPEFEKQLDNILNEAKKRKRQNTAKWMSTFLPGSGQIYAKNAKGAIGAIGVAAFWGGWFAYDIIQKDYYSALLVLLWPWQRYHRGNIQNAELSVDNFNAIIEDGINRELLEYLSKTR